MRGRGSVLHEVVRGAGLLGAFLVVCVAAGVLFSGLFLPGAATVGFLTRSGVDFYDDLPTDIEEPPLSEYTTIAAADGSPIATIYRQNREVVPLSSVSQTMIDAILAIEDSRFYEHGGVDTRGTARALVNNVLGGGQQGASTLTQQYVKNVLLENAVREGDQEAARAAVASSGIEGYQRKLLEARYAIAIEERFTKEEILERYLNISNFGGGGDGGGSAYGIFAASRYWFQVNPADLSLTQAALLAGIVQRPNELDPVSNPEAALSRRNTVLARMLETEKITQEQFDSAVAEPITVTPQSRPNGCEAAGTMAFFCDHVIKEITAPDVEGAPNRYAALGETREERIAALYNGGLTITTTVDPRMQQIAWEAVRSQVPETDRAGVAMPVVQPGTGQILAMAQNRVYGQQEGQQFTEVNFSTSAGANGVQPGSTFKPFVLARWLESGRPLSARVDGSEPLNYDVADFATCVETASEVREAGNAGDSGDTGAGISVLEATFRSVNTAYLRMAQQLNLCEIRDVAARLGVTDVAPNRGGQFEPFPSMVLGVGSVTPLAMAGAYAAFAADGLFCPPTSVTAITGGDGAAVELPAPACTQALDPEVARGVNYALQQTTEQGTARQLGYIGFPIAGKTGTTQSFKDTWFAGYNPSLAAVVWIGDTAATPVALTEFPINGQQRSAVYGSTYAVPTWEAFMPRAVSELGIATPPFNDPGSDIIFGPQVRVPSVVGTQVSTAESRLAEAGFTMAVSDERRNGSGVAEGLVAAQSPGGGGSAPAGSTVTVFLSGGGGGGFLDDLIDSITRPGDGNGRGNGPPGGD
ncbi:MAG: transglycosylase domain-containing protein [Kineosporiaceae bacterium]